MSSTTGSETVLLSAPVRALVAAVAQVAQQLPADVPAAQAAHEAAVVLRQAEALHMLALTRVADVEARQLYALSDAGSTGTWVEQQGTSLRRTDVALARRLASYPRVSRALVDGGVPVEAGRGLPAALSRLRRYVDRPDGLIDGQPGGEVVTAVVTDGVHGLVCQAAGGLADDHPLVTKVRRLLEEVAASPVSEIDRLEAGFLVLAENVPLGDLPGALSQLVDAVLPNELERRADEGHARRSILLRRTEDGAGWVLRGELDLECGEYLDTVLRHEMLADPDNPADTEAYCELRADGWLPGDALEGGPMPRTRVQQRHDAMSNALRRYLDSGIGGLREKHAPHIDVVVGLELLHGDAGAMPAVGGSGAVLPASLVRRWWCDSKVTRYVMSLGRRVIEVSHSERTLKAHERRAKSLETGRRCQTAGCTRGPGHRLVPHHAHAWARTGTTSLADSVLFCDRCHHDLHSGNRRLRLKDGRRLGPEGWVE